VAPTATTAGDEAAITGGTRAYRREQQRRLQAKGAAATAFDPIRLADARAADRRVTLGRDPCTTRPAAAADPRGTAARIDDERTMTAPARKPTVAAMTLLVGAAAGAVACGGERSVQTPSARAAQAQTPSLSSERPRSAVPVEDCSPPVADPLLVRDRYLEGALTIGPLVIDPADDIRRVPRALRRALRAPKIVMITTDATAVTLTVGRSARARFSLLFAGATPGNTARGLRLSDGTAAVRFPACGRRAIAFRGGFLYRGPQCVPITVQPDGRPRLRATIAVGRPAESCPDASGPRR
jgi:hypothetical protein